MGKGEIARYEQFLLFPPCFQKACFPGAPKCVIVWEWVKMTSAICFNLDLSKVLSSVHGLRLIKKKLVPSPRFQCGKLETGQHYLLECRHCNIIRNNLFKNIENLTTISLDVLLYGDASLTSHENVRIF